MEFVCPRSGVARSQPDAGVVFQWRRWAPSNCLHSPCTSRFSADSGLSNFCTSGRVETSQCGLERPGVYYMCLCVSVAVFGQRACSWFLAFQKLANAERAGASPAAQRACECTPFWGALFRDNLLLSGIWGVCTGVIYIYVRGRLWTKPPSQNPAKILHFFGAQNLVFIPWSIPFLKTPCRS